MNNIKSHIQMPKSIMKSFSHKGDGRQVYYLDLKDNSIKVEKINTLGTALGYYSEETENHLADEVETPLGNLTKKARDFSNNKISKIEIGFDDETIIKKYIQYSLVRSKKVLDIMNRESKLSFLWNGYRTEHIFKYTNLPNDFDFFEDYRVTILSNLTKSNWVCPRNCFISGIVDGKKTKYIIPVNEKIAFLLIDKNEFELMKKASNASYYAVCDVELVENYNMRAYYEEKHFNNSFLISKDEETLIRLLENIKHDESCNK